MAFQLKAMTKLLLYNLSDMVTIQDEIWGTLPQEWNTIAYP